MMTRVLQKIVVFFTLGLFAVSAATHALAASPGLLKAKENAEAKGYIFFTSHDEIVAMAKKEGKLNVSSGLEASSFRPLMNAFKKKYPFITDIHVEEIAGAGAYQRFLLEIKAGQAKKWDVTFVPGDFASEYMAHLMKHDILGMAKNRVLGISSAMIQPTEGNILSYTSGVQGLAYNKRLVSDDKVPTKWEDFLKPEFKGKKFVTGLRPQGVAGLVPAWGLERTLDFARKLAAQHPIWNSGSRITTAVAAGEYSLYLGPSLDSVNRVMRKDPTGDLSFKIIEPVSARFIGHTDAILNTADHPHCALLWLEFLASREAQELLDKYEPFKASIFNPNSLAAQAIRSKELSVVDWDHFTKVQEYQTKVFAAYGFPKADQ